MTAKKNKKPRQKNQEETDMAVLGTIVIALLFLFPHLFAAMLIFSVVGVTSERWCKLATLGKIARETTDPKR